MRTATQRGLVPAILLVLSGTASAQERLGIALMPLWVTDARMVESAPRLEEFNRALSRVHEALALLGVRPTEYDLSASEQTETLECDKAAVHLQQQCFHERAGTVSIGALDAEGGIAPDFDGMSQLVGEIHEGGPGAGRINLYVLIMPEDWAWLGYPGIAQQWLYGDEGQRHWSNTGCKTITVMALPVLAHELGHCFGLMHNDKDDDYEIDLMLSSAGYKTWLKPSNIAKIRHHFREDVPPEAFGVQPKITLRP